LDYTTNLEDHCPDGDLFAPAIKARKASTGEANLEVCCPECDTKQMVTPNSDYEGCKHDAAGYLLDELGEHVITEHGPLAVHYARRCFGMVRTGPRGEYERCTYRWTHKECPHCGEPNDIAARYCIACKGEIVNPNEKLSREFKALKKDPTQRQTDRVIKMETREGVSMKGNRTVRADFVTPYRSFSVWYTPDTAFRQAARDWGAFVGATAGDTTPGIITYQKEASGFYRILDFNKPEDVEPSRAQ
jgi:DNA repair protein RadD